MAQANRMISLLLLSACSTTTVQVAVTRPAAVNVHAHGGTVTIERFGGDGTGAQKVRDELVQRTVDVVDHAVTLLEAGGSVIVGGDVESYVNTVERKYKNGTCSESVKQPNGTTSTVQQPCTLSWYEGNIAFVAILRVRTSDGQILFQQRYAPNPSPWKSPASKDPGGPPDYAFMLDKLRTMATTMMARAFLPYRENVGVQLFDCVSSLKDQCKRAAGHLQAGQFDAGVLEYGEVMAKMRKAGAPPAEMAKLYWNRSIAYEYGGQWEEAERDAKDAVDNGEGEDCYANRLRAMAVSRKQADAVKEQGLAQ